MQICIPLLWSSPRSWGRSVATILKRALVQIGLGAVIGLPIAAQFVFGQIGTPDGRGSVAGECRNARGRLIR